MDAAGPSPQSLDAALGRTRQCVFCLETIQPGASVCPHCGSNLAPLQTLADRYAALELRLAALEQQLLGWRSANADTVSAEAPDSATPAEAAAAPTGVTISWPHMADNIFLGLATLLVAHWLATTVPGSNRTIFRLVALVVAAPFGFRFQRHSRSDPAGQVLAALAFGCLGTLAIGVMDLAVAGHAPSSLTARDVVASVAVITLSHFAGSSLARAQQRRADRDAANAAEQQRTAASSGKGFPPMHLKQASIKSTAETVKALYDAAAPLVAATAALWAALAHTIF
jgi:hypothetical protein